MAEYGESAKANDDERDPKADDELLEDAREQFAEGEAAWSDEKRGAMDDLRFGRLGQQWPDDVARRRLNDGRPCLTINDLPASVRQVVNDGRQNRPQIKIRPIDNGADPLTADVLGGIVKHIESISHADVAYDTALECAVSMRIGYIGVEVEHACDDTFDLDLKIVSHPNPSAVTRDARTQAVDSSDWRYGFVSELIPVEEFKKKYPKLQSEAVDFSDDGHLQTWFNDESIRVAKWYKREETTRTILLLSDRSVVDEDTYLEQKALFDQIGVTVQAEREVPSYQIFCRTITGKDIIEERSWKGKLIPIVPVYGEMINEEGKWHLKSLITDAKDAQMMFNLSRSTLSEIIGRTPKTPWVGPVGSFTHDPDMAEKWASSNTENWPYLEYKQIAGATPPTRPGHPGLPDGLMQDIMAAADDKKRIIGIHDASLGLPGAEISGRAIRYRQHQGDISTSHFTDNLNRGIRGVGEVLMELIPQIYSGERVARIIGTEGKAQNVKLGPLPLHPETQAPVPPAAQPQVFQGAERIYDLTIGRYDVTVEAGPSYTTRRQETAEMLTQYIQASPNTAPILGPVMVKLSDLPEGEKISDMLATMMPPAARQIWDGTPMPPPGPPPEVQAQLAAQQAQAQADQRLAQQKAQHDLVIEQQKASHQAQLQQQALQNKLAIEQKQAEADVATMQMKAQAEIQIMRERAQVEAQLKREEAQLAAQLKMVGIAQSVTGAPTPAQIAPQGIQP